MDRDRPLASHRAARYPGSMPIANAPAAEVAINEPLIRRLLRAQHPDLADRPLRIAAQGWDNVLARLGDDLVVRLPRRALAATLIQHEQRWLPELATRLPLPVPAPVRLGTAGDGYPWSWSICPWFAGTTAAEAEPTDADAAAEAIAAFLTALHRPAPEAAPVNAYRGVPLGARAAFVESGLELLGSAVDQRRVRARWADACRASPHTGPPVWLHGDLHPANVIVRDGAIAAVVDFGDVTRGDPATDLSVAWMLFAPAARRRFRCALGGVDEHTWQRAAGNALAHALACLARSADAPIIAGIGRRTLEAVLADA
jgi:aminoglycoside phosphotransferase (APT) family kinase protein